MLNITLTWVLTLRNDGLKMLITKNKSLSKTKTRFIYNLKNNHYTTCNLLKFSVKLSTVSCYHKSQILTAITLNDYLFIIIPKDQM